MWVWVANFLEYFAKRERSQVTVKSTRDVARLRKSGEWSRQVTGAQLVSTHACVRRHERPVSPRRTNV